MRICAIPQTGLHCADVYYTANINDCSGSAAKYCMILCNCVNRRFIARAVAAQQTRNCKEEIMLMQTVGLLFLALTISKDTLMFITLHSKNAKGCSRQAESC